MHFYQKIKIHPYNLSYSVLCGVFIITHCFEKFKKFFWSRGDSRIARSVMRPWQPTQTGRRTRWVFFVVFQGVILNEVHLHEVKNLIIWIAENTAVTIKNKLCEGKAELLPSSLWLITSQKSTSIFLGNSEKWIGGKLYNKNGQPEELMI